MQSSADFNAVIGTPVTWTAPVSVTLSQEHKLDIVLLKDKGQWTDPQILDMGEMLAKKGLISKPVTEDNLNFGCAEMFTNTEKKPPVILSVTALDPQQVINALAEVFDKDQKCLFLGVTNSNSIMLPQRVTPLPDTININYDRMEAHQMDGFVSTLASTVVASTPPDLPVQFFPTPKAHAPPAQK